MTSHNQKNIIDKGNDEEEDSSNPSNHHRLIDNLLNSSSEKTNSMSETNAIIPSLEDEYDFEDEILNHTDDYVDGKPSSMNNFWKEHCGLFLPMGGWFIFSVALSSYNKYVFGKDKLHFPCPLLLTSIHFLSQWVFSYSLTAKYPEKLGGDDVVNMDFQTFWGVSLPCGLVTSTDVGLSNLALARITLTFYTMVKASSPIFVVASAFLFGIESITWTLIVVVLIISAGELLTGFGEVDFDWLGFVLCALASVCSGLRWTLVQLKLNKLDPPLRTSIATMRVISPSMFVSMLILTVAIEHPWDSLEPFFKDGGTVFQIAWLGLLGAFLAISMILCEFYLIMNSTAVVLMIGGVLKEVFTIFFGVLVFQDKLNAQNTLGSVIVFMGVILFKVSRQKAKSETKQNSAATITSEFMEIRSTTKGDCHDEDDSSSVHFLSEFSIS